MKYINTKRRLGQLAGSRGSAERCAIADELEGLRKWIKEGNGYIRDDAPDEIARAISNRIRKLKSDGCSVQCGGSVSWAKGDAPLNKIVLLWNGRGLYGPVAFENESDRELYCQRLVSLSSTVSVMGGKPTHYLVIPKCT